MRPAADRTHRRRRQRGTVYVLVLAITSMLIVLGIAGSMLARQQLKQTVLQEDQTNARLAALSYLDVVHKRLDGDATWRSSINDNTWYRDVLNSELVEYKVVDDLDGNIDDDITQPFRLYARATVGDCVRVYSVELVPDDSNKLTRIAYSMRQETNE